MNPESSRQPAPAAAATPFISVGRAEGEAFEQLRAAPSWVVEAERLKTEPTDPFPALEILLGALDQTEARDWLISALSASQLCVFEIPEVRCRALEELRAYSELPDVQELYVRELERDPAAQQCQSIAIEALNAAPEIGDQGLIDRLCLLVAQIDCSNPALRLANLSPKFSRSASPKLVQRLLKAISAGLDQHVSPLTLDGPIRALGVSNAREATEQLKALAMGERMVRFNFFEEMFRCGCGVGRSCGFVCGGIGAMAGLVAGMSIGAATQQPLYCITTMLAGTLSGLLTNGFLRFKDRHNHSIAVDQHTQELAAAALKGYRDKYYCR
ncbi:MAG: hypothetical protein K1X83_08935 [Oligoflexia bacterium]|nr:hypothetical protein [Oligoflexia bacterium]